MGRQRVVTWQYLLGGNQLRVHSGGDVNSGEKGKTWYLSKKTVKSTLEIKNEKAIFFSIEKVVKLLKRKKQF